MSNSRPTQIARIIRYLRDFGSISSFEAFRDLGVTRLAARIHELKRKGFEFTATTESSRNRYGDPVSYARYRLVSEPKETA